MVARIRINSFSQERDRLRRVARVIGAQPELRPAFAEILPKPAKHRGRKSTVCGINSFLPCLVSSRAPANYILDPSPRLLRPDAVFRRRFRRCLRFQTQKYATAYFSVRKRTGRTRMWNESYGLVLSFAITAMFWVAHFRLLRSLSRATAGLIYLNLFQLFWIALLPISTSLLIRIKARETTIVMVANLTLIALSALL
jgi:Endosomal/lysosomal potassium channel TMEM175